jgi:hypothetical protein
LTLQHDLPLELGKRAQGISDLAADLTPKRMDLLKQMVPGLRRLAMLWNTNDLGMTFRYRASENGAQALGIQVQALGVRGARGNRIMQLHNVCVLRKLLTVSK